MGAWKATSIGAIAMLAAAAAFAQQAGDVSDEATTWYVIAAEDGAVLGNASIEVAATERGRDIIENQEIYLREQAGEPTRTIARSVRSEDGAGRTVSIGEISRRGRFSARTEAHIAGDAVRIVRQTPSSRWTGTVALPPGVRFDAGEALLRGWDPATSPRLEFDNFSIDAMAVERIVIEAAGAPRARGVTAVRRTYEGAQLRGVVRLELDGEGRVVGVAQPMFGETIRTRLTDRATALRAHEPYQVVPNFMTRSPFRISSAAAQGHIRYRFAFRDGFAFALPRTGEQRVSIEAGAVTIDVCGDCGPGLATDAASLADAQRPTAWLQ
ncbi:MAG: hypothetical protein ACREH4_01960, partial [Vitreimonas sp.]